MSRLRQILQREIAAQGVIPFSRFMELALYCPELGYYERPEVQIGRRGDFYTSVSVGRLFGELLAFQFAEWLSALAGKIYLVEAGAHDGGLARDVLSWLRDCQPHAYANLEYWIVEPRPVRRAHQSTTLEEFAEKLRWCESLAALPVVKGIIFANELLDAFPVKRYVWHRQSRSWLEAGVGLEGEQFVWKPFKHVDHAEFTANSSLEIEEPLLAVLPDAHTIDTSPAAVDWWRMAATKLASGSRLVTFDYGLTAEQLLAPERSSGTLRAYQKHRQIAELLANAGGQDLTAHVNFTALQRAGETAGLKTEGLWSQEAFLTQVANKIWSTTGFPGWTLERTRQFQTLTHPNHLGHTFKVLVQAN